MSADIAEQILSIIDSHGRKNEAEQIKLKKNSVNSKIGLGVSGMLGTASIAFPIMSVPLALLSFTLGGKSIRDTINDHLSGKKQHEQFKQRPLGILYQLKNESEFSSVSEGTK